MLSIRLKQKWHAIIATAGAARRRMTGRSGPTVRVPAGRARVVTVQRQGAGAGGGGGGGGGAGGGGRDLSQEPLEHGIARKALGEPLHVAAGFALEHGLARGIARRLANQRGGEYPSPFHLGQVTV